MPTAIAFLRAINVAGRFIKMTELASHFNAIGHDEVSTYINSGNVIFSTRARNLTKLAAHIEDELEPLLGFRSEVFLRTPSEVHRISVSAESHRLSLSSAGEVNVAFLNDPLTKDQMSALEGLRTDLDEFAHTEREIYWLCKGNQMDSKFSNAGLERKLTLRSTLRRVSMLTKLSLQLRAAGAA